MIETAYGKQNGSISGDQTNHRKISQHEVITLFKINSVHILG